METQLHRPHHHHEEDHGQNPGLPSVMEGEGEGEQQQGEKKSVLKKVKDKAKKIKNTIKKHGHGHGHDHDNEDDQNDDPQPHAAPMYESSGVRRRDIGKESMTNLENPRDKRESSLGPMGFVEDHHSPNADFPSRPAAHLVPQFNNLNVDEKRHDQITTTKTEANPVGQPETGELNPKAHDSADTESTVVASKLGYGGDEGHDSSSSKKPISEYAHKVKEYLSEKFRPGEEDRELSKVITNALGNKKETKQLVGKVTMSEEVAARLGDAEKDAMESGQQSSVEDRLRDAIWLWLGKTNVREAGSGSRGAS